MEVLEEVLVVRLVVEQAVVVISQGDHCLVVQVDSPVAALVEDQEVALVVDLEAVAQEVAVEDRLSRLRSRLDLMAVIPVDLVDLTDPRNKCKPILRRKSTRKLKPLSFLYTQRRSSFRLGGDTRGTSSRQRRSSTTRSGRHQSTARPRRLGSARPRPSSARATTTISTRS